MAFVRAQQGGGHDAGVVGDRAHRTALTFAVEADLTTEQQNGIGT